MNRAIYSTLNFGLGLRNLLPWIKYKLKFTAEHPDFFYPDGLLVFCGDQGSGKTVAAVKYIDEMCKQYPKMILCTNIAITGLPAATRIVDWKGFQSFTEVENGESGVLYFLDEIQLEFSSLESRNIPLEVITEISQQRKQRKHIVGTAQRYGRVAKPLREQINTAVGCRMIYGPLEGLTVVDGSKTEEKDGKLSIEGGKTFYWVQDPKYYAMYNTWEKVKRLNENWSEKGVKA